jgi:hypothetical protein
MGSLRVKVRAARACRSAVAGVMVNAESGDDARRIANGAVVSGFKAVTSTDGAFEIGSLRAASYRLSVLDNGRPIKATKAVKLALSARQRATGVEVVVERPAGTIRGAVTRPDGASIAEAWVAVHQSLEDQLPRPRADGETRRFGCRWQHDRCR